MHDSPLIRRANNRRALRPLCWWAGLVLLLFLIRTHQQLNARTNLKFALTLAGHPTGLDAAATLDGRLFYPGMQVNIGWHTFSVTHPKTKTFTTNLFIWYGERDLETIALERATGTLALSSQPSALQLSIRGPEFSRVLTNSAGLTCAVPTDQYVIEARFKHLAENATLTVSADRTAAHAFAPKLGAVSVACNQTGATFELLTEGGRIWEQGRVPARVAELPARTYQVSVRHRDNQKQQSVTVGAGNTHEVQLDFEYGVLTVETEPSGATVVCEGRTLGTTPITLTELAAGQTRFSLAHDEYETAVVILELAANQTNRFQTNLVSRQYTAAMRRAQSEFAAGRFDEAAQSAAEALKHQTDDSAAQTLQRRATGFSHLARAKAWGERSDFEKGIVELKAALEFMADHAEVRALLADYTRREAERVAADKQRAAELAERMRKQQEAALAERKEQAQTQELREAFKILLRGSENAGQFTEHELATSQPVAVAGNAVKQALASGDSSFQIVRFEQPRADLFALQARQMVGVGYRDCFVAGSQVRDNETRVLFKVLEYDHPPRLNLLGGLITATVTPQSSDPNRAARFLEQVREGATMVQARIQAALK